MPLSMEEQYIHPMSGQTFIIFPSYQTNCLMKAITAEEYILKRILAMLLCLATLLVGFASCSSGDEEDKGQETEVYTLNDTVGAEDLGLQQIVHGQGDEQHEGHCHTEAESGLHIL